jgi:NAD(P)H dehydrogenase (quinone)
VRHQIFRAERMCVTEGAADRSSKRAALYQPTRLSFRSNVVNVLIVYAHEEPQSFNGALRDRAVEVLTGEGHEVTVSDLYATGFDPVGGKRDFTELANTSFFKYGKEQALATERSTFAPDVAAEQRKLLACDLLIFQFPLWWFGLPAVLKGWVDRVFAAGLIYSHTKWYSTGQFRGRRAMVSMTTSGGPPIYSETGLNGDINQILFPIHHGIFYFVGFDVLPPFIAWSVSRVDQATRTRYLDEYAERLRTWQTTEPIKYPPLDDFDENYQLRAP